MTSIRSTITVYIVDADASARRALSRLLRAAGFQVLAFGAGQAFLDAQRFRKTTTACLVLDIDTAGAGGLEVAGGLGRPGVDVPVITLSATDNDGTRQMAKRLRAKMFFGKPVDESALVDTIEWVAAADQTDP